MPSTVLFKFRHSKTFEPLTFPGSFTKLFQIKKTISEKLKLGFSAKRKPIDFELAVQDAVSGIEYTDEEMVIIDGARLIVYRIPAEEERGKGLLARIQRHQPTKNKSYMHRINGNKPIVIESCNEEEDFDNEHVTIIRTGTDESSEAEEQKDSRKRRFREDNDDKDFEDKEQGGSWTSQERQDVLAREKAQEAKRKGTSASNLLQEDSLNALQREREQLQAKKKALEEEADSSLDLLERLNQQKQNQQRESPEPERKSKRSRSRRQ